ncbi:hypothetical protein BDR03DRAFT_966467 [Suillus americanus]|nr:hypothetical protein BDR03DRAFT_966467 [Suillus americanus]
MLKYSCSKLKKVGILAALAVIYPFPLLDILLVFRSKNNHCKSFKPSGNFPVRVAFSTSNLV